MRGHAIRGTLLIFLLIWHIPFVSIASPLTDEQVKGARHILLMPGTFDPFHNGHLRSAESALAETGADLLIVLPLSQPPHKEALPFTTRIELVNDALKNSERLAYPIQGHWRTLVENSGGMGASVLRRVRELNPGAKVGIVVGQDVGEKLVSGALQVMRADEIFILSRDMDHEVRASPLLIGRYVRTLTAYRSPYSSSAVRDFLHKNFELYFAERSEAQMAPNLSEKLDELEAMLPRVVADKILARGLYLNRPRSNQISPYKWVKRWLVRKFVNTLFSAGFYDDYKQLLVSVRRRTDVREITINEISYPIKKYLGSGMSADAYLIDLDGEEVAVKIARNSRGRQSILSSIPVHLWAQQKMGINSPRLVGYDPDGHWVMTEFIRGPTVRDYLKSDGDLPDQVKSSILKMHGQALAMSEANHIGLDFASDNLIIKDGQVYLVDLGPIPIDARLTQHGQKLLDLWQKKWGSEALAKTHKGSDTHASRCETILSL